MNKVRILLLVAIAIAISASPAWADVHLVHLTSNLNLVELEHLHQAQLRFEAAHPGVTIEFIRANSAQDRIEKIMTMYSSGILPDVVELQPEIGYQFAMSGLFLNLDNFMQKDSDLKWDDFVYPAVTSVALPQKVSETQMHWLLPESFWIIGTVFNLDMFDESGIAAPTSFENQWTWSDFRAIGKKLLRKDSSGKVVRYGAEVKNTNNRWPAWVHNAGGWYFDQYYYPTESRLKTEPVHTALQFLKDIYINDGFATWDNKWGIERLNVAIGLHAGPNYTTRYVSRQATNGYAIGPWPKLVRGGCEMSVMGRVISSQSKAPKVAWEWIKYLSTDTMTVTDMINKTSNVPALRRAIPLYTKAVPATSEWEHVWFELVIHPDSYVRGIYSTQVRDTLQPYIEAITTGKIGVADGLAEADRAVTAILNQEKSAQTSK